MNNLEHLLSHIYKHNNLNNLSDNTIISYTKRISSLVKDKDLIDYFNEPILVIKDIELKYNKQSSVSILWTVIYTLKTLNFDKKIIDEYFDYYKTFKEQKPDVFIQSIKEKNNWMTMKEILEVKEHLLDIYKQQQVPIKALRMYQDYLIVSLYTDMPPLRQDFVKTLVFEKRNKELEKNHNYIFLDEKVLVLNKYKTSKRYGVKNLELPDILVDKIKHFLELRKQNEIDTNFLLINKKGLPATARDIFRIFERIFKKRVSVSMLRKIYISEKYQDSNFKEMKKDAFKMGHSINTQQGYYKKYIKEV